MRALPYIFLSIAGGLSIASFLTSQPFLTAFL